MVTTTAGSGGAVAADAATPAPRAAKTALDVYKQSFREYLVRCVGSNAPFLASTRALSCRH